MNKFTLTPCYKDMLDFKLIEALLGRRSRQLFMSAKNPDDSLVFKSYHSPKPLSELKILPIVVAFSENTG
jgi:hypothetical protein